MFHERAVNEHEKAIITPSDMPLIEESPHSSSPQKDDDGDSSNESFDAISAISLSIPRGKAVAMPSIQISEEEEKEIRRDQYGGKGDKPHLGGFTEFDVREMMTLLIYCCSCVHTYSFVHPQALGVSPSLWKHMVTRKFLCVCALHFMRRY